MEKGKRNILMIGRKVGMTQLYDAASRLVPVSVVEVCRTFIASIRAVDSDGYAAVLFGFAGKKNRRSGDQFEKLSDFDRLKELRVADTGSYESGTSVLPSEFENGDFVDVIGTTRGKGFQGVMKRHGFSGGPATHGAMFHRRGGSYGNRQWPGHVFKGKKMPGHDGCVQRTIQNLRVVGSNVERNLLLISGSFPGANGSYVVVRRAKKAGSWK